MSKKIIIRTGLVLLTILIIIIAFSPYRSHKGYSYKLIKTSIEINASTEDVFKFLGKSANAHTWSVFVDHISLLNSDSISDGNVGSKRRCFCYADEKGTQWDELMTEVIPYQKRQLTLSNLKEFALSAENLATEQIYESLTDTTCKLTFTLFYKDKKTTYLENIKTYFAAYKIKNIFKRNMNNIKLMTEKDARNK